MKTRLQGYVRCELFNPSNTKKKNAMFTFIENTAAFTIEVSIISHAKILTFRVLFPLENEKQVFQKKNENELTYVITCIIKNLKNFEK